MTLCRRETAAREVCGVPGGMFLEEDEKENVMVGRVGGGGRRRSNNKWFHYKADEWWLTDVLLPFEPTPPASSDFKAPGCVIFGTCGDFHPRNESSRRKIVCKCCSLKNLTNLNINFFICQQPDTGEIGGLPFDGLIIICDHHVCCRCFCCWWLYERRIIMIMAVVVLLLVFLLHGWLGCCCWWMVIKCQMAEELTHKPSVYGDVMTGSWFRRETTEIWMMGMSPLHTY